MVTMESRPAGHFYSSDGKKWYPGVTTVLRHYPKGEKFYEWVARNGYNAEQIKQAAGNVGTRVHKAIEELVVHGTDVEELYIKYRLGPEEHMALIGFSKWRAARNPEILHQELQVVSHRLEVGGTVDLVCRVDGEIVVGDFKTSRHIGPTFWLQLHAYAYALAEMGICQSNRLMVLHLNPVHEAGYREVRQPYRIEKLRQFYALRYLSQFISANDRTRSDDQGWDDVCELPADGIHEVTIP